MDKILNLLNQILEKKEYDDSLVREALQTGDNWDIYHLKLLKTLLEEYNNAKK
jgi:hypothetical protein